MWNETMIKSFLALSECENITMAAEKLFFSQQALSKQISKLEMEMGCKLIERGRRGIKLTEEGKICEQAFRKMMETIHETKNEINKRQDAAANTVLIGQLEMGILSDKLRDFYRNFGNLYPEINLKFAVYDDIELLSQLKEGNIDVAIGFNKPARYDFEEMEVCSLAPVKVGVCVKKIYPGAEQWKNYKDIPDIPIIMNKNKQEEELERVKEAGFSVEKIIWAEDMKSTLLNLELLKGATLITNNTALTNNREFLFFPFDGENSLPMIAAIWKKKNPKVGTKNFVRSLSKYVQNIIKQEENK